MNLNELQSLHIKELTELAKKLDIGDNIAGLNKQELTIKILEANAKKENAFFALTQDTTLSFLYRHKGPYLHCIHKFHLFFYLLFLAAE